jgi:hypothetical protein
LALALAVALAQAMATVGLVGFAGIRQNLFLSRQMIDNPNIVAWLPHMHNFRQLALFVGAGNVGYLVLAIVAVAGFSVTWLVAGRSEWTKMTAVFLACLVSPHLFLHDLSILLIPVALATRMAGPELLFFKLAIPGLCGLGIVAVYPYPIVSGLMLALFAIGLVVSLAKTKGADCRPLRLAG